MTSSTGVATAAERAARYVREALLQPAQVDDVSFDKADPKPATEDMPAHAHGDFGHADR